MANEDKPSIGIVKINDEVIGGIAGVAAGEIKGVAGMARGIVRGLAELFGKKTLNRGVKVEVIEGQVTLNLYIVVHYGIKIPEVAWEVQENVKKAVEKMTGLSVRGVNVYIEGISLERGNKTLQQELPIGGR